MKICVQRRTHFCLRSPLPFGEGPGVRGEASNNYFPPQQNKRPQNRYSSYKEAR